MKTKITLLKTTLLVVCLIANFGLLAQTPVIDFDFENNLNDTQSAVTDLTTGGTAAYVAGRASNPSNGQAYLFDGSSNYLNSPTYAGITGTGARTVMMWINVSTANYTSGMTLCDWGDASGTSGWRWKMNSYTGTPSLRWDAGGTAARASIKNTQIPTILDGWHHLAMTFPAGGASADVKFYVDGILITGAYGGASASAYPNSSNTVGSFRIGARVANTNPFKGEMDDFRVYTSELTAAQVLTASGIVAAEPVAGFSSSNVNPTVEEIITFSDASTNDPNSWSWDFGDVDAVGDRTAQNPQVSYPADGTYTVTLTATNAGGSDVETKTDYITVSAGSGSGTLQAQYDFDNAITDASSYGRDLMVQGAFAPSYANDHLAAANSALTASGINADHLLTGYSGVGADGARTVTAWFNVSGTAREPIISWGKDAGGAMFNVMLDNGVPRVEAGSSSLKTTDSGLTGAWHHIAVTYDPIDGAYLANCKIYIDGVLSTNEADSGNSFGSETTTINTDIVTNFLKIGSAVYSTYALDGALDDVRVYSKALTSGEITTVMSGGALAVKDVAFTSDELMVYPTMVSDFLNVRSTVKETSEIAIYNILGSVVIRSNSLESETQINMSGFSNGLYIVKIRAGNKVSSLKVIKN